MGRLCLVLLIAITLTGCDTGPSYVPVTGSVKYSDGSVPAGDISTITFQPASPGPASKGASSTIAKDGSFSLQTIRPGDGALPGDYKVTVHVMEGYPNGKSVVAERFTKQDATPLTAAVTEDGENRFDFQVERP